MRVFQSVSLLSNRQERPPDFSISAQWVFVVELIATLQLGGMGTSHCLPLAPFLMFPIWHELDVWVSRPSGWASAVTVAPMTNRTRHVGTSRAIVIKAMLARMFHGFLLVGARRAVPLRYRIAWVVASG